jgi:hypothetical protein
MPIQFLIYAIIIKIKLHFPQVQMTLAYFG